MSKTFIKNDPPERGKRVKMQYEDIAEYNEEMQEALDDSLRVEARARKGRMDEWEAQQQLELEESNEEPLTRISSGPSRKDMMGSLAGRSGNFAEAGGADEGDSLEDMLKDDSVRQLLENDEDFEEMFKRLSSGGNLASNDESLARIMKELGKEDNGEIDPSSFLNEADRKEWENFVGEMEGADNNRKETALDGGLESNDMMSQLSKMMSTAEDDSSAAERVEFQTSQSSVVDTQATVDAFKTLNSLLGFLDDSSGGVSMKEHYVSHNKSITGGELRLDSEGLVATQEIDKLWDLIEFGRPPKPDYSDSLRVRRDKNIDRALEIYDDMITREQIQPNEKTLAGLVGVIGNASLHLRVEKLIEEFKAMHNVIPNDYTYNAIVKMHVIRRDIHSALDAKNKMLELGFRPSRESYGMLINSLAARKMIEEALLTLEETADKGIIIRDVHLRELRRHCTELGIIHPDLPEDPMAWMKAVRQARKNIKNKSKYSVQPIQSGMYN